MPVALLIVWILHTLRHVRLGCLLVTDYGELRHLRRGRVNLFDCIFGIKAGLSTSWIILFWFHNRS